VHGIVKLVFLTINTRIQQIVLLFHGIHSGLLEAKSSACSQSTTITAAMNAAASRSPNAYGAFFNASFSSRMWSRMSMRSYPFRLKRESTLATHWRQVHNPGLKSFVLNRLLKVYDSRWFTEYNLPSATLPWKMNPQNWKRRVTVQLRRVTQVELYHKAIKIKGKMSSVSGSANRH